MNKEHITREVCEKMAKQIVKGTPKEEIEQLWIDHMVHDLLNGNIDNFNYWKAWCEE